MATKKSSSTDSRKLAEEKRRDLSSPARDGSSHKEAANSMMREEEEPMADGPSIVTHLPDVVVFTNHKRLLPNQQTIQGVVLFLDISGFTALCEKYSLAGKTGTDQLTKTLNGYMSALVSEIVSYDGDILKFAGDAILTLWQVDDFITMQATVGHVIQCALDVQLKNGEYMTSVGVVLKVKIGIAAGEISILCIGNNEQRSYVEMGRAVDAVNKAEHFCNKGDVVVSPTAWCHCYKLVTDHIVLSDGKHVKVNALLANNGPQYVMRRTIHVTESMLNLDLSVANLRLPGWVFENPNLASPNVPSPDYKPPAKAVSKPNTSPMPTALKDLQRNVVTPKTTVEAVAAETISPIRRLRKAVISRFEHDTIERLKLYVAQPVLKKLDEGQPLDYLSEMRQVTILFINLIIDRSTKVEYACTMQACFDVIFDNCKKSQGSVSKIFLFDKGCTFIVIFGLPGFKHENDCAHALICADCIDREMIAIEKVTTTSIGVTTGPTYCGVVGHNHRHEYTVIGRKVNMAARLMMYYPGKVTCDNETYYHSKLSKGNFIAQELKEMKGLQNVGTIRCFKPKNNVKETIDVLIAEEQQRPIIGRDVEVQLYQKELGYFLSQAPDTHHRQLIVINGEPGMGKTRMLDSIVARALKKKIRVVSIVLTLHDSHTPYNAVTMMLIQLFEFDLDSDFEERESYLQNTFSSVPFIVDNLCLFNSLLNVRFTMDLNNYRLNDEDRMQKIEEMLLLMLKILTADIGHIIFAIDDAHLMDVESWKFMPAFGHYKQTMLIITLRTPWANKNPTAESLLSISATLQIQMGPLSPQFLAALACQLLNVTMIPRKLDKMLRQKSMGVPSWVELLLREYMFEAIIRVEPLSDYQSEAMVSPAPKWVRDRKFPRSDAAFIEKGIETEAVEHTTNTGNTFLDRLVKDTSVNAQMICAFVPDKLIEIGVPGSIKGMIQAKIDKMEEIDQMFIKTASILRDKFPRKMFESIIQTPTEADKIGDSLQRLADQGIFACYTKESAIMNSTFAVSHKKAAGMTGIVATCMCMRKDGSKEERPMRDCQFITFQSTSFQETAYEMLLENNRRPLHLAAAQFLESQVKKCLEGKKPCTQGQLMAGFFFDDDEPETVTAHIEPMEPIYSDIEIEHFDTDAVEEHTVHASSSRSSSKLTIQSASSAERSIQRDTSTLRVPGGAPKRPLPKRPALESESAALGRKTRKTASGATGKARLNTIIAPVIPVKDRRMTIERNLFSYKVHNVPTPLDTSRKSSNLSGGSRKRISSNTPFGWTIKRLLASGTAASMMPSIFPASATPEVRDVGLSKNEQNAMLHINLDAWEKMRVLSFIYPQIVEQYRRAGNIQNTVYYLTEAAAACISLCDYKTAYDYLVDVRSIFKALKSGKNPFEGIVSSMDSWMFNDFQDAQVERLSGEALYHVGETKRAVLHFRRALALLNCPIPRNRLKIQLNILHATFTQYKHHLWPTKYQGTASAADAGRLLEQAKCLNYIFLDSSIRKKKTLARYAALEQVNKAEQAGDDICALIGAYTCMLQISEAMSLDKISESYEDKAKVRCVVSMQDIRPDNLLTMTKMLWASFSARISRIGFLSAIQSGNIASQLMTHISVSQSLSRMLPTLVQSYFAVNRLQDATEVLARLKVDVSKEDPIDFIMICWYYCCCMDLILYGGIRLEDTRECILFAKEATTKPLFNDYPLPLFYLACTICVWYQRIENAGKFRDWMEVASEYEPRKFDDFLSVSAFLKLIECKMLDLSRVRGIDEQNKSTVVNIKDRQESINRDLEFIHKQMTQLLVLKPRVAHLKAYLAAISGRRSRSRYLLDVCMSIGVEVDNTLECQWAARNHFHWFGYQSPTFGLLYPDNAQTMDEETDRDYWKENATKSFPVWSDHTKDSGGIDLKYPLPIPFNAFERRPKMKEAAVSKIQLTIERTSDASAAKQPLLESIAEPSEDITDEIEDP